RRSPATRLMASGSTSPSGSPEEYLMAQYSYQAVSLDASITQTPVTPTTSDTIAPDERGWLMYENSNAAGRTITIVTPAGLNYGGVDLGNLTSSLAATTGRRRIGPMTRALADPTTGLITIQIDATAGVTVAACRM